MQSPREKSRGLFHLREPEMTSTGEMARETETLADRCTGRRNRDICEASAAGEDFFRRT
jgi:hypothetical protein